MTRYWIIIWLINQSKVLVISQAPGDQDNFCITLSASITPPSYPPNTIILMDSYNYILLLPSRAFPNNGVWQQVDVDGLTDMENNNAQTSWIQVTSSACREAVSSCYFNLAPPSQNNWLITQHISREVNGSLLPQVSVQVEFQLTGCEAGCQRSFVLEVWETSNIDLAAARNTTQYRRVQRVAPNSDSGLQTQNASIPVNFNTNESGFYLAFVDDNTCIAITRIIVFYYVCPEMIQNFIIYPETLSPSIDTLQPQKRKVQGHCVEGAEGQLSGKNPSLQCIQAGKWDTLQPGTGCQCKEGFFTVDDDQRCTSCPAGEYASQANSSCHACPANTRVDEVGVSACPCLDGYYRAPGEDGDFPCTPNTRLDQEGVTICQCLEGYYRLDNEAANISCTNLLEICSQTSQTPKTELPTTRSIESSNIFQDSSPAVVYVVLSVIIALLVITLLVVSSCFIFTIIKHKRLWSDMKREYRIAYQKRESAIQSEENPAYAINMKFVTTEKEFLSSQSYETDYVN